VFKNVLKKVRPLFLISLLVLAILAILTLGPIPTYTNPELVEVSTYHEGSTSVVKGTALNGTGNLDANDQVYYAVASGTVTVTQSQTLTYSANVSSGGWSNVPNIDADDTSYASVATKNKVYSVDMDNHTISGTISSVVIKIDCWVQVDETRPEFELGFSPDAGTTWYYLEIHTTTTQATYNWDITGSISWTWTKIDNLRLSAKSLDYGGGANPTTWYVDYHRVEVQATIPTYEVDVRHTSEQVVQLIANVTQIFLEDNFKFNRTVTAYLKWFNWTANAWANINSGSVGTTEVTWNKTWTSRFSDVINSTGYMKVRIYTSGESSPHRLLEDHLYWNVTYRVPDITPPAWSNAGTNNTKGGQPTRFHVKWTDNAGLSGFIFGTNNTGTWANDTWTPMSGTTNWSNVTKILNSSLGVLVRWRVWANDTSNNWNNTGILSLVTVPNQPPVAIFTESAETVNPGDVIHFNASASYDPDGYIVSYFWDFGDGTNTTILIVDYSVYATSPYIAVVPTSTVDTRFAPGVNYTVSIYTNYTGSDIQSWQFTLNYNSSILNGVRVTNGDLITTTKHPNATFIAGTFNNTAGKLSLTAAFFFFIVEPAPITSGPGTLATVTFTVVGIGASNITLGPQTKLIGYTGNGYGDPYDIINGTMTNRIQHGFFTNVVTVDHSYSEVGNYTVTLTVTDDYGATNSTSANKMVVSPGAPVASFTYSPTTPYTDETVTFNATSSYDSDGYIVSYAWDFGDDTNGTGNIATHSYTDDGTYTVILNVTDDDGLWDTASANITVLNRPPVASFTESAETVLTGQVISFNASASSDPDGTIASYFWDFGDETNATGMTATHSYSDNGTYTVTLTVTDDDGATDTANSTKTVSNRPPIASFTESAETVYTNQVISFNASSSSDPDGTIVSYFWDFGDGANATSMTTTHSYSDDGTYIVTLTVTDDDGATASANATKTVLNRPPVAIFTESAEIVDTQEVIHFNASLSYDPDGTFLSYFWDFGDGNNGTGVAVDHSYTDNGTYTVTLTVTDNDGATDSANSTKTARNRPPVASFTESAETVLTGQVISFNASASSDLDGSIFSYFWTFGDGTNATGMTTTHSYSDNGTYTVTLTVTDDDGATDTISSTKTVLNRPPVASFTESAETVYTNQTILFNASASYDLDGSIFSYFWVFGDGTNATGVTTTHSYADDGTYTVILTVTDDDGATDSVNATKTVLNRSPVAVFTESAESVYVNVTISFNASLSYDPDGSIFSYFWTFGDGTNATGMTTTHYYTALGNYTVTLTVTDDDGATASASATKFVVENLPPVALFTENATTVLTGEVISFNASASYDPDGTIASYFWDFGDGTNATGVTTSYSYADDGNYTVTLTVTDDGGAIDTATSIKYVLSRPPVALFTENATIVLTGEVIFFNASSSYDPDGSIASYFWDFGDGTNGTGRTTTHSYADDGTYAVTLTVTDDDGVTDSANATKTVLNRSPVASFTENATIVLTGEVIFFNASASYDPDGSILSYFWNFGDGTNATGIVVDHAYADDGVYNVTLTVTDNDGATNSTSAIKTVSNRPPVAEANGPYSGYEGSLITFDASGSTGVDGTIVLYEWDWDNNGTYDESTTSPFINHTWTDDYAGTVGLRVTDDDGLTDTDTASVTVNNVAPTVEAGPDRTAYMGRTVNFTGSFTDPGTGDTHVIFWDFGDRTNTTGTLTPTHIYTAAGNYTVTLTVTDDDGGVGTDTLTVKVFEVVFFSDVAVIDVALSASEAYWTWTIQINVTVKNNGTETASFNVTAYFADSSSWHKIGTQTVTDLPAGENMTLTFNWNLAGLMEDTSYTVKANATLLEGIDINPDDNEKVDGQVKVGLWGDVNGDGKIDILDLKLVKLAYSGYIDEPMADLDGDGEITILDLKKMKLIYSGYL